MTTTNRANIMQSSSVRKKIEICNWSKTYLQVGQNITFNWGKPVGNQAGHCVVQVTSRIMFINKHEQQVDSKQMNICEDILRTCIITHHLQHVPSPTPSKLKKKTFYPICGYLSIIFVGIFTKVYFCLVLSATILQYVVFDHNDHY